jgi:hypothetical protein
MPSWKDTASRAEGEVPKASAHPLSLVNLTRRRLVRIAKYLMRRMRARVDQNTRHDGSERPEEGEACDRWMVRKPVWPDELPGLLGRMTGVRLYCI